MPLKEKSSFENRQVVGPTTSVCATSTTRGFSLLRLKLPLSAFLECDDVFENVNFNLNLKCLTDVRGVLSFIPAVARVVLLSQL